MTRVLVVDDHRSVRHALRHVLTSDLEAEVVGEAATGEDAVALAARTDPDIVFLDVQMPGMGGPAAAVAIRAADAQVRIIALTAAADPSSVAEMIAAGADSYLVKTSRSADLRDGIARILDGQTVLAAEVLPGVVADLASRLRTERSRADAQDAFDRLGRELVYLISDRLDTPLTTIRGHVRTLGDGWDGLADGRKLDLLARIDSQADQLSTRLAQILAVTRLHGEAHTAAPFALDAVVREVADSVAGQMADRDVSFDLEAVRVTGDRRAVAAAISALLDNALLHTTGAVDVRLVSEPTAGVLEIADEGPGFDVGHLADGPIMVPPGAGADTKGPGGPGLSLHIATRIAEAAGGALELQPALGRGTCARLRLPRADARR